LLAQVDRDDVSAFARQAKAVRATLTMSGTCDERRPASESHFHLPASF